MSTSTPHCPKCGSTDIARILYGAPKLDPATRSAFEAGQVTFGGNVMPMSIHEGGPLVVPPAWQCNMCDSRFGDPEESDQAA